MKVSIVQILFIIIIGAASAWILYIILSNLYRYYRWVIVRLYRNYPGHRHDRRGNERRNEERRSEARIQNDERFRQKVNQDRRISERRVAWLP